MNQSTGNANQSEADEEEFADAVENDSAAAIGASLSGMQQILERLNESETRKQSYADAVADSQYASDLRRAFAHYQRDEDFRPGDLVQWKPMLRNRPYPAEGAPAVVVRYLQPTPSTDSSEQSEVLDLELGFLDGEQDFLVFAYSSARFTRWTQ
jgi:hypothetical protein